MNFRFLSSMLWSRTKLVIWAILLVAITAGFCFMNLGAIQNLDRLPQAQFAQNRSRAT